MISDIITYAAEVGMWLSIDNSLNVAAVSPEILTEEIYCGMELHRSARDTAQVVHELNLKNFFRHNGRTYKPQHSSIHPSVKAKAHIIPMSLDDI
jgi:hypothetical protein